MNRSQGRVVRSWIGKVGSLGMRIRTKERGLALNRTGSAVLETWFMVHAASRCRDWGLMVDVCMTQRSWAEETSYLISGIGMS